MGTGNLPCMACRPRIEGRIDTTCIWYWSGACGSLSPDEGKCKALLSLILLDLSWPDPEPNGRTLYDTSFRT
jgi:hypothetical protein